MFCPCLVSVNGDSKGEAHECGEHCHTGQIKLSETTIAKGSTSPSKSFRSPLGQEGFRRSLLMDIQHCYCCLELQVSLEQLLCALTALRFAL